MTTFSHSTKILFWACLLQMRKTFNSVNRNADNIHIIGVPLCIREQVSPHVQDGLYVNSLSNFFIHSVSICFANSFSKFFILSLISSLTSSVTQSLILSVTPPPTHFLLFHSLLNLLSFSIFFSQTFIHSFTIFSLATSLTHLLIHSLLQLLFLPILHLLFH